MNEAIDKITTQENNKICNDCKIRKHFAKLDFHFNWIDCPYECNKITKLKKDNLDLFDKKEVIKQINELKYAECKYDCKHFDKLTNSCSRLCKDYIVNKAIEIVRQGGNDE